MLSEKVGKETIQQKDLILIQVSRLLFTKNKFKNNLIKILNTSLKLFSRIIYGITSSKIYFYTKMLFVLSGVPFTKLKILKLYINAFVTFFGRIK